MQFWAIIQALPQIISLASAALELIKKGADWVDLINHLKSFDVAADKAKTTKDTSDLEHIIGGGQ